MALINCPECGKEISDKAPNCPNCGCPISVPQPQVQSTQAPKEKKNALLPILLVVIGIAIIAVVSIIVITVKNNNSKKERENQIAEVKTAMDNVDSALGELFDAMKVDPFLYGSSESDSHKAQIKGILDKISDNQKIVEDAYKNEDREFVKELDDYISSNKTYRSWDEYSAEIKKLYGDSVSNDQAADNLVKEMASSEKEYRDFKNHYFVMKFTIPQEEPFQLHDYDFDYLYDPEYDFSSIKKDGKIMYRYQISYLSGGDLKIQYLGDKNPKEFSATFTLLGTNGMVLAESEFKLEDRAGGPKASVFSAKGEHKYSGMPTIKEKGLTYGDWIHAPILDFYSDIEDTPTDLIMTVTSDDE